MIHSTAIIHPDAKLDPTVRVGPYAVIDAKVVIGAGCVVGPQVYLTGVTTIGSGNRFHAGCVIGDAPQDLKYRDEPTCVRIGDNNVFREHSTVHRSTKSGEATVIGSNNFFMANAHVGHNCAVGDHVILANGALLGGHVVVQDRAFISGNCMVHQFTRVGMLAMMRGGAGISKDLAPFTVALGENEICGLNIVGLRRAGFRPEERLELKRVYRAVFRSGRNIRAAASEASPGCSGGPARLLLDFVLESKRGVCADSGASRRAGDDETGSDRGLPD